MPILENVSLKPYNTFGIDVKARWLSVFTSWSQWKNFVGASPIQGGVQLKAGWLIEKCGMK